MPSIVVDNIPVDVYERLRVRAEAEQRTVPEEAVHLLDQALRPAAQPPLRLPDLIPSDTTSPAFDLPRSSSPVTVSGVSRPPRLPDIIGARDS